MPKIETSTTIETMKRSARVMWAGIVGLATLGGVLGLYQFFADQSPEPLETRSLIAQMIEDGTLDADRADELIALIDDTAGGEEVLASAFEDGSAAQIEALSLVAKRSTFDQGIEMLKAQAETADDWRLISELASAQDKDGAVDAARKAVALNPGEIELLELLAKVQLSKGDYSDATRTAASIDVLATTPRERLVSETLNATLDLVSGDETRRNSAEDQLKEELVTFTERDDFVAPDGPVKGSEAEAQPYYLAASATNILAYIDYAQEDWNSMLQRATTSLRYYEALDPYLSNRSLTQVRVSQAGLHDLRATAMHRLDRIETHHEAHEKAIALRRTLAEDGDVKLQLEIPASLKRLGIEYEWLGETDKAIERVKTAIELVDANITAFPEEWELPFQKRAYEATLARLEGEFDKSNSILLAIYDDLETDMLRNGSSDDKLSLLYSLARDVVTEDQTLERERDAVSPLIQRMLDVISRVERRYGSSESLTRMRLSQLSVLAADHQRLGNTDEALSIYRDLLDQAREMPEDAENKSGYILYSLYYLAENDSENAVTYAQEGYDYALELRAAGELTTREQVYVPSFEKILEAPADNTENN